MFLREREEWDWMSEREKNKIGLVVFSNTFFSFALWFFVRCTSVLVNGRGSTQVAHKFLIR